MLGKKGRRFFVLAVVALVLSLALTSCGYDIDKKYDELETKLWDNTVDYESFMKSYKEFSEKLEQEIEDVELKYRKTGEGKYYTRLDTLEDYRYDIEWTFVDKIIKKAQKLSKQAQVDAASEIYELTDWYGPNCSLVVGDYTVDITGYNPAATYVNLSTMKSSLDNYLKRYELNFVELADKSSNATYSSMKVDVSSPWGMTIEAVCSTTLSLEGFGVFTTDSVEEYDVLFGSSFVFPEPLVDVYEEFCHFVGWSDGYNLYAPGDSIVVDNTVWRDFTAAYVGLEVTDRYLYDDGGDGGLSAGEGAWIDLTIHNDGNYTAYSVSVEMESESDGVTIVNGKQDFCDIRGGYYTNLAFALYSSYSKDVAFVPNYTKKANLYQNFFAVKIAEDVESGTEIDLNLRITDSNGFVWEETISFVVE